MLVKIKFFFGKIPFVGLMPGSIQGFLYFYILGFIRTEINFST